MIGCGGTGLSVGRTWQKRYEQLAQMHRSLRLLHGEIRYAGTELPEAIEGVAVRQEAPIGDFYHFLSDKMRRMEGKSLRVLWQTGIEKYLKNTCLTKEDKKILLDLGGQLGYLDREMQLSSLEASLAQMEDSMNALKKCLAEKQKLSVTLGLLSGFFLMILLI